MADNTNNKSRFMPKTTADYNTAVSASVLHNSEIEDQVLFLYTQLMNMPFSKIDTISQIEKALYTELSLKPGDTLALIALMQTQTMQGNHDRAKALAYKLWEVGSKLTLEEEYLYVNNLLNLGLLEMASVFLKPHFEKLSTDIAFQYPMLLKISTMTGNAYLIERLATHPNAPEKDDLYMKIIARYKNYKYTEHFKNIQRIIIDSVKERLCVYDYDVSGSVMEELEVILYLSGDNSELKTTEEELAAKIEQYYQSVSIEKLSSFSWKIKSVFSHQPIGI